MGLDERNWRTEYGSSEEEKIRKENRRRLNDARIMTFDYFRLAQGFVILSGGERPVLGDAIFEDGIPPRFLLQQADGFAFLCDFRQEENRCDGCEVNVVDFHRTLRLFFLRKPSPGTSCDEFSGLALAFPFPLWL